MSFRFFDPKTKLWSIYWADIAPSGVLDPPVVRLVRRRPGVFEGRTRSRAGRSSFASSGRSHHADAALGAGVLRGRGETWETNWVMEFTRAEDEE